MLPKGLKEIDRIRKDWIEITLQTQKKAFNVEVEEGEMPEIVTRYVNESKKQSTKNHVSSLDPLRRNSKKFLLAPVGVKLL